ncbi:hypothetical protein DM02DRAFT_694795 [Periconia macrospinosa]|uniref:Uncharacterized protein n=1 Tax=Periconia macrospinosa TaxID=97972 RepID=A0A2V1D6W0_9PLEO|nr:hypothetical protein DM02DRAFT_694795 [Periconia macrospinosa]
MVTLRIEGNQEGEFSEKVVAILDSTLPPGSTSEPLDAAKSLNELFKSHSGSPDAFLWRFWDLFHDLARQLPYDGPENERMAVIVKELHALDPVPVVLEDWGGDTVQVWRDLPLFRATIDEQWCADQNAPDGVDLKQRQLNLQTYAARVFSYNLVPLEQYAIWALTEALEGTMTPIRGAPDEENPDPSAVEDLPFKTAVASAWMIHGGTVMYGRDEEVHGTLGGPLWRLEKKVAVKLRRKYKGTQGLCADRWQLWKERFGVIRDSGKVDEITQKRAAEAYDVMEKIERQRS